MIFFDIMENFQQQHKITKENSFQTIWTILGICPTNVNLSWRLGCPDLHNIQRCKQIFGTVMYGNHKEPNQQQKNL